MYGHEWTPLFNLYGAPASHKYKLVLLLVIFFPETTLPGALTYVPRVQQKRPKSQRKFAAKKMRQCTYVACAKSTARTRMI